MLIGNKYEIIEKIGSGGFGTVYKGINKRTEEFVAIKVEPILNNTRLLKREAQIYQYIGVTSTFPHVKWFGKDEINYYLVINLLGDSIRKHIEKNGKMSKDEAIIYGKQMMDRIFFLHEKRLVHGDIKPENFVFGLENTAEKTVFLIDYGFTKNSVDEMLRKKDIEDCMKVINYMLSK